MPPRYLIPFVLRTAGTNTTSELGSDSAAVLRIAYSLIDLNNIDAETNVEMIDVATDGLQQSLQKVEEAAPGDCLLVTNGPTPVRQVLHPQALRATFELPKLFFTFLDISHCEPHSKLLQNAQYEMEEEIEAIKERIRYFARENENALSNYEEVKTELQNAVCWKESEVSSSVVVRARGLPWQATDRDVAQFFIGLNIAPGGVALCLSAEGRRNGEALVRFADTEQRELALRRHRQFLHNRYIEVYRATGEEFLQVAAGTSSEAVRFVSRGGAMIVRMRGLPYDCTEAQIREFFAEGENGCKVMDGGVLFVNKSDGRPTGDAFVMFADEAAGQKALTKHKHTIGSRYIELFRSTQAEVQQVVNRNLESVQMMVQGSRKDCIRLRGLPYEAHVENIVEFLGDTARHIVFQVSPGFFFLRVSSKTAFFN